MRDMRSIPVDILDFTILGANDLKVPLYPGTTVASPGLEPAAKERESLWTQRRPDHHRANSEHIQTLDSDQLSAPQSHLLSIPGLDVEAPLLELFKTLSGS